MLDSGEETQLRQLLAEQRLLPRELAQTRQLLSEARQIGAPSLLRRLLRLVYDATDTIPVGGPTAIGPIESQNELQHAFYLLSAIQITTNGEELLYQGTVAVFPANSVTVAIGRRYNAGPPTQVDTYLEFYNTKGVAVDVQTRVYRVAGLT